MDATRKTQIDAAEQRLPVVLVGHFGFDDDRPGFYDCICGESKMRTLTEHAAHVAAAVVAAVRSWPAEAIAELVNGEVQRLRIQLETAERAAAELVVASKHLVDDNGVLAGQVAAIRALAERLDDRSSGTWDGESDHSAGMSDGLAEAADMLRAALVSPPTPPTSTVARAEIGRLRDSIQALADDACHGIGCTGNCDDPDGHVEASRLRSLLDG